MINDILEKIDVPKLFELKQTFKRPVAEDLGSCLKKGLKCAAPINKGQTIAITVGSRGFDGYKDIVAILVAYILKKGAKAVLIPSMGSHGGATFHGQEQILKKLGILSDIAEVIETGKAVCIGSNSYGDPIYLSDAFLNVDGVIILNRVKPHTSFRGTYESGLVKMAAVGMGGPSGAMSIHGAGYENIAENIESAAKTIFGKTNIVCGVATIENAYGEICSVDVIKSEDIFEVESGLLKKASKMMPKLPFYKIDVLIVDEIGKNISGTGMDTNIIGRYHTKAAYGGPDINKIVVLGLSHKSEGNANGVGLADFTTRRLFDSIDFDSMYMNVLTSTAPTSAKIPPVMDTDELAIKAALHTCNVGSVKDIKIVRIKNTKDISNIKVSKNLL